MECSLNGVCTQSVQPGTNSSCRCDAGWIGKRCETLDLLPASACPHRERRRHDRVGRAANLGLDERSDRALAEALHLHAAADQRLAGAALLRGGKSRGKKMVATQLLS